MLMQQQLFNLSDEELVFQVNDRRSSMNLSDPMNNIPDATTIAFSRERLRKSEVIDATLVSVPSIAIVTTRKRKSR